MPDDRVIDGISMASLLEKDTVIHTEEHPILHMKRESVKAVQYAMPSSEVEKLYPDYDFSVLSEDDYITFKYFEKIQNDNSAFWNKNRKNWLHILNDDYAENYNRSSVYPEIAELYKEKLHEITEDFKNNRRGIIE